MAEANEKAGVDIDRLEQYFRADPGNFVLLARAYIERNLPIQAIHICKEGLSRAPSVPDGQLALAMAYYHNYNDGRAEMELKKILRSSPDNHVAHRTLGEIYLERSQEKKAVTELMRALEIEPSDSHTRVLLESLDEKVPTIDTTDGQPEMVWLPRQIHVTNVPPKPVWRAVVQVLAVMVLVVVFLVWYNHHVAIVIEIRSDIKEATKLVPRDNFDDLIGAEDWLGKALALNDEEAMAIIHQSKVQSRLYEHHAQTDRLPRLKAYLKWFEEEELQISERYGIEAMILIGEGKADQAVAKLNEVITRAIEKRDIFLNAMVFGVRGSAYLALGNIKEAREDYSRAAKFSSLSPHYQALFSDVYLREGNLGRAIKYFKDALRKNPDHVHSNLRMAFAQIQHGKGLARAKRILDTLFDREKHPEREFSPPLLSMLYQVRGEYALAAKDEGADKAKKWADKALVAWDGNAEAYNLKGRLATLAKDGAGAGAAFKRALELDPRLPKTYFDRAESMFSLGRQAEAIDKLREFEKALKPTVAYYIETGTLLMRMEKLEQALEIFKKAIENDELDPKGRFWTARAYQAMGDKVPKEKENEEKRRELYNKAREEYENSIMLPGGETADVYYYMGLIYLAMENYENALDNLAKSAMMMTKAGDPPEKIAKVYEAVADVFEELGGEEGKKRADIWRKKAEGLRKGLTLEEVEKEAIERQKQEEEKKKKKKRRKRRKRRRHRRR